MHCKSIWSFSLSEGQAKWPSYDSQVTAIILPWWLILHQILLSSGYWGGAATNINWLCFSRYSWVPFIMTANTIKLLKVFCRKTFPPHEYNMRLTFKYLLWRLSLRFLFCYYQVWLLNMYVYLCIIKNIELQETGYISSFMVWLDYNLIRNSDPNRRWNSAETALNQRWFNIFRIRIRFGAESALNQRRISADLILRNVV